MVNPKIKRKSVMLVTKVRREVPLRGFLAEKYSDMIFKSLMKFGLTSALLFSVVGCELDSTDSVCDATEMNQIHVDFRATVTVIYDNGQPVDGAQVSIIFSKTPCAEIRKGYFNFDRLTVNGYAESGLVGYNFQNGADLIEVVVRVQTTTGDIEDIQTILASDLVSLNGQTRLVNFTIDHFPR